MGLVSTDDSMLLFVKACCRQPIVTSFCSIRFLCYNFFFSPKVFRKSISLIIGFNNFFFLKYLLYFYLSLSLFYPPKNPH